jgi:predicted dehydrogenase
MVDSKMDRKAIFKAAVIGCGNIGSKYDEDENRSGVFYPKTHASAYQSHQKVSLEALCDSNEKNLKLASDKRNVKKIFSNYSDMIKEVQPDFVSLCASSENRKEELLHLFQLGCKHIICEKPLALNLADAQSILNEARSSNAHVTVNHPRRWSSLIHKIKKEIQSGVYGSVKRVNCVYGKGLFNNGSHMVNLLNYFFEEPTQVKAVDPMQDGLENSDATINFFIKYKQKDKSTFLATGTATDFRDYSIFELDIFFSNARLRIIDNCQKLEIYKSEPDSEYPNYKKLILEKVIECEPESTMLQVVNELVNIKEGTLKTSLCGIEEVYLDMKILDGLKTSALKNQSWIDILKN